MKQLYQHVNVKRITHFPRLNKQLVTQKTGNWNQKRPLLSSNTDTTLDSLGLPKPTGVVGDHSVNSTSNPQHSMNRVDSENNERLGEYVEDKGHILYGMRITGLKDTKESLSGPFTEADRKRKITYAANNVYDLNPFKLPSNFAYDTKNVPLVPHVEIGNPMMNVMAIDPRQLNRHLSEDVHANVHSKHAQGTGSSAVNTISVGKDDINDSDDSDDELSDFPSILHESSTNTDTNIDSISMPPVALENSKDTLSSPSVDSVNANILSTHSALSTTSTSHVSDTSDVVSNNE